MNSKGVNSKTHADDDTQNRTVKLKILGKDMQIGCAAGEEHNLRQAAQNVHASMLKSRERNKALSVEKLAILTAINLANELLHSEKSDLASGTSETLSDTLKEMADKIDGVLAHD